MLASILVTSLLVTSLTANTTYVDPGKSMTQMVMDRWTADDGLPQNSVVTIIQTSDGYLWLGTDEGLVRFNGLDFTVFDRDDRLGRVQIVALEEDHQGRLWVGTLDGVVTVHEGEVAQVVGIPSDARVEALLADGDDGIYVGTWEAGVFHCRENACQPLAVGDASGLGRVQSIAQANGIIWVGSDSGVFRVDQGILRPLPNGRGLGVSTMISPDGLALVVATREGVILTVSPEGVLAGPDAQRAWPTERVWAMMADDEGALWFGMENQTLLRQVDGRLDRFGADEGLPGARVLATYEDREGSVWVGMEGGGLVRFRNGAITIVDETAGLSTGYVTTLFERPDTRTMLAGTYGGGVHEIEESSLRATPIMSALPSPNVTGVMGSPDGRVWVATIDEGIFEVLDGRIRRIRGLPSNSVYALRLDSEGTLWAGTDAGLARITKDVDRVYSTVDGLGSDSIVDVDATEAGVLWVATYGGGLTRLTADGNATTYTQENGLGSDLVSALYRDSEGTLWIGTLGGGLSFFTNGTMHTASVSHGLFDRDVFQILEDDLGFLWMGSNRGISRIRKQHALDLAAGLRDGIPHDSFGTDDGLKSPEINGGAQPSGWKSSDGRLWFPTVAGVAVLDPGDLRRNPVPPPVVVEQIEADGVSIPVRPMVELPPGTRRIEFKFAALSLVDASAVTYRYRLQGLEDQWSSPLAGNTASYTFLEPGTYTFNVTATNNDGYWNEAGASILFDLRPYFYQTSWFWMLLASVAFLAGAWMIRSRTGQLQRQREELERMVEARTRDVLAAKDQIQAQSDALRSSLLEKDVLLREVHHRVKNNLQMISSLLQLQSRQVPDPETKLLFDECRNRIYSFSMVHERLYRAKDIARFDFVDYLTGLAEQLVRSTGGSDIDIELDVHVEPGEMDVDRAISCGLIMTEFVTNALRHAFSGRSDGTIRVEFARRTGMGILSVEDDGLGMPDLPSPEEADGLGLRLVSALVSRLRGEMTAERKPTGGTLCEVRFPMTDEFEVMSTSRTTATV
ncbi:MAG: hypothetical protein HKN29_11140 [Rhodothermales bacterium]|nr:hypothetical protein [Rhodothermales bacterium]